MAKKKVRARPLTGAPLAVVILAAGEGKRMKSALPKVLQPLAGVPLLKRVVDTARALKPASIAVVYGHGGEAVRAALSTEELTWVLQQERRGTGHAVQQALPHIEDGARVLILYGDVPLLRVQTLEELLLQAGDAGVALLSVELDEPEGYGRVVRNARGRVQKIVEQKDASRGQLKLRECNAGVLVAPARRLRAWLAAVRPHNAQGEYYLTDVIALAVKSKVPVTPLIAPTALEVLGVNDKVQLAQLEGAWRGQMAQELMRAGVTLADPARVDVRGTLSHGSDVSLDVNVLLEGRVVLGDRVRIGPGCVLRNCEIGAGSEVFAHCVLDGAIIGPDCRIGPFARVRPASTLAASVHIGNFVEVKNSQLGDASKANHLSYVGDATVGAGVNIGAGTIIANYDGANKHRTEIADDVHTGSNSVLVAPITVGAGATIAAGSTVSGAVPAGKLTVARARQTTIEDWQRPSRARK